MCPFTLARLKQTFYFCLGLVADDTDDGSKNETEQLSTGYIEVLPPYEYANPDVDRRT